MDACVAFGRDVCTDVAVASAHEWLLANGLGGFASGTLDGSATRRYHGLLVAALTPPAGRALVAVKYDERVEYRGVSYALTTNRWASGSVDPLGYFNIERFYLDGTTAVWEFALADGVLERRIVMEHGANQTLVRYKLLRASAPMRLIVKAIVDNRDFHGSSRAGARVLRVNLAGNAVCIAPDYVGAVPTWLQTDRGDVRIVNTWYRDYDLPAERERGLEDREDHLHAATFMAEIAGEQALTLRASAEKAAPLVEVRNPFLRASEREGDLLQGWREANGDVAATAPPAIRQLVLAADQFVVARPLPGLPDGRSVVAGYHWFGDWGRDAMIALPGLTLTTGRAAIARSVLRAFDRFLDGGMLPNEFPERGAAPSYNTVDAALWYVEAVRAYVEMGDDAGAVEEFWPTLAAIVERYTSGTRYGIRVDDADGLLRAGVAGSQVTWMDAKVGDVPVTPRIGKAVEVNALWYNALRTLEGFAPQCGQDAGRFRRAADRVLRSFSRFEDDETGGLLDVVDGPGGDERAIRPNQIFAASLFYSPIDSVRRRGVVDICARELLTPMGLRSLAPSDPAYAGRYAGGPAERDAAYHQGTAWIWLIGPFVLAHHRAYGNAGAALAYLQPLLDHVSGAGVGTLPEIADGDAPFHRRGCIAQAWSVGEVLRAWHQLRRAELREDYPLSPE
ncbi:MAG: glycogen debranching enzyme family protein [Candidatus Eremiobacteraeota bacterium]|nr:glycogen debranching enzyme family protein [Candidatus Eremiobacteraeota bacterium]